LKISKEIIRRCKLNSKQYNGGQNSKVNNDLQNITQKTKD